MSRILVVIPAYNEEENIAGVIVQVKRSLPGGDILVVNDGSVDRTGEAARKEQVMVLDLSNNLGIGGALQTGYKFALKHGYDIVVQIDGDGQHSSSEIPAMIKALQDKKSDIVIGSRFINQGGFKSTLVRRIGIYYFSFLIKILTGVKIYDPTSGFRVCGRAAIEHFAFNYPADYASVESIIDSLRNGLRISEVPVTMAERTAGVSSISRGKAVYYMIKVSLAVFFSLMKAPKKINRRLGVYEKNTNNYGG
ncbi:MAG: glycosyltransferase family 2 protein [Peptococcaceae bacterium]|jgi:glycosyltransferase involved in cell wall biosynthesis|nr:glycosyltransferase family 2 protein [Peptococcaceae bacterium]MDH7523975.1 glycosyltransferase family 2 protein [Peptococcaceae bacterium]